MPAEILFHYLTPSFYFPNRKLLKAFIIQLAQNEKHQIESINIIFCTDEYLLNINQQFLNHDTYTDIITFQHSKKSQPILSDIYISIERIKENAQNFSKSFQQELHRIIFHGILHLCGYKDKAVTNKKIMTQKEDFYLKQYSVSREI